MVELVAAGPSQSAAYLLNSANYSVLSSENYSVPFTALAGGANRQPSVPDEKVAVTSGI